MTSSDPASTRRRKALSAYVPETYLAFAGIGRPGAGLRPITTTSRPCAVSSRVTQAPMKPEPPKMQQRIGPFQVSYFEILPRLRKFLLSVGALDGPCSIVLLNTVSTLVTARVTG